jgi:transposase
MLPKEWITKRSGNGSIYPGRLFPNGASVSSRGVLTVLLINRGREDHRFFPPQIVIEVKALACELPWQYDQPLSRFSTHDIAALAQEKGIVAKVSGTTVWRWLTEDAIKPWRHRSWIFPRDPQFSWKAARVLDLYHNTWKGNELGPHDYVICADEKTSIQARHRRHRTSPPRPGTIMRVEHEYERKGALDYLAAWDVHRARLFGRCVASVGIKSFDGLVGHVMSQYPYHKARRVFWILDNASYHRGETCVDRLTAKWSNIVPVHLPIHASWLNQIEIYFSILQRKVLTPNVFVSLVQLENRILSFQDRYETIALPSHTCRRLIHDVEIAQ